MSCDILLVAGVTLAGAGLMFVMALAICSTVARFATNSWNNVVRS